MKPWHRRIIVAAIALFFAWLPMLAFDKFMDWLDGGPRNPELAQLTSFELTFALLVGSMVSLVSSAILAYSSGCFTYNRLAKYIR